MEETAQDHNAPGFWPVIARAEEAQFIYFPAMTSIKPENPENTFFFCSDKTHDSLGDYLSYI